MATYHRKGKHRILKTYTCRLNDGEIEVQTRQPSTTETLHIMAKVSKGQRILDAAPKEELYEATAKSTEITLQIVVDLIAEVKGVMDDEGNPLSWKDMDDADRYGLLDQIHVEDMMHIYIDSLCPGMLTEEEKKSSTNTPST